MVGNEQMARAQYVSDTARRTVWIRQRTDGMWEAIDWYGTVVFWSKYRSECEKGVKEMATSAVTNIYAIAVITEPSKRRKHYSKPTRRVF